MKRYQKLNELKTISITKDKLITLDHDEILMLMSTYSYKSQWEHKDAWDWLQYYVAHKQGRSYAKTGKKKSFKRKGIL